MTREQAEQIARKHVDLRNKTEGHEDALSLSVAVNAIMEAVAVRQEQAASARSAAREGVDVIRIKCDDGIAVGIGPARRNAMNVYTLNAIGQTNVFAAVREYDNRNLVDDAYFDDAEQAANDAFDSGADAIIEVRGIWSVTGNPVTIRLDRAWFDAEPVEVE